MSSSAASAVQKPARSPVGGLQSDWDVCLWTMSQSGLLAVVSRPVT